MLWLSLCEFKLGNFESYKTLISRLTGEKARLNRYEKYILQQILADVSISDNENQLVYKHLNLSLKFAANDNQRIKIYNKLINFSEQIEDYDNLVIYLDKLYPLIEDEREKKEIKLLAIDYHKKIRNFDYLISEIENLLSLSSFNDKSFQLTPPSTV